MKYQSPLWFVLSILCIPIVAAADEKNPRLGLGVAEMRMVAQSEKALVHAIQFGRPENFALGRTLEHAIVLHTDLATGEMKTLFASNTWEVPTRRSSYYQNRILGVLRDIDHIYIAVWNSGRIWDRPPGPPSHAHKLKDGQYSLHAFRLDDGSLEKTWTLREGVPEAAPAERIDFGVLQPANAGVGCFGKIYSVLIEAE